MEERDNTTVSANTLSAITHLLTAILRGEEHTVAKLCASDIVCKFGSQTGNGASGGIREMCLWAYLSSDAKCALPPCCSHPFTSDVVLFAGDYQAEYFPHGKSRLVHGDYTIILVSGKISFISITPVEQLEKCLQIKAVNKSHVSNIKRCDDRHCIVTMVNGDILPVPYQKFVSVREELMSF
jgi:hypothetical protein